MRRLGLVLLLALSTAAYAQIEGHSISKDAHRHGNKASTRADGTLVNNGCDCGSTVATLPCGGTSISITVPAITGGKTGSENATFSWEFNSDGGLAACGKFANGDYWIAPAFGETTVTITAVSSNNTMYLDVDPAVEAQPLHSGYSNYDASQDISDDLPQSFGASIASLVAAKKRDVAGTNECGAPAIANNCIDAIHVLTVLPSVPALNGSQSIRPNITGTSKAILSLGDFDFTRVPSKSYLTGPDSSGLERIRQRWTHSSEAMGWGVNSEGGRAFRSHILVDDYGSGRAQQFYSDLMLLFSDDLSIEQKKPALAAMIAYGLDNWSYVNRAPDGSGRFWGSGAGQSAGRFPPAVFAVALMTTPGAYATGLDAALDMIDVAPDDRGPHELEQINPGINGPVWGDGLVNTLSTVAGYWGGVFDGQCYDGAPGVCDEDQGSKTERDPYQYIDGPQGLPGSGYMNISLGTQRSFLATFALVPHMCSLVVYPALEEYVTRTDEDGLKALPDPCAPPDPLEDEDCDPHPSWANCTHAGVTWGPSNLGDPNSACIANNTGGNTGQTGRFPARDGLPASPGHTTSQIENNWAAIMADGVCEGVW